MATSAPGIRRTRLPDQAFAASGRVSVPVKGMLPPGRRLRGYEMFLDAIITQPGAGQVAQLGAVLHQLVKKFTIGRRIAIGGLGLRFLNWAMDGYETDFPAGFPATAGGVFSRKLAWFIPTSDYSSAAQHDGAIPTELAEADEVGVDFANPGGIFAATAPTVAGTLRTYAVTDSARGKRYIPVSHQVMDQDFSTLSAVINKAGRWPYVVVYREAQNDAGGITDTQVSSLTVRVDGEPVILNARPQDLASGFNRTKARSPNTRLESQTAPVAGEAVNAQPAFTAAAGLGVTCDFLAALYPGKEYVIADVPEGSSLQLDLTGTLGAYKVAYLLREPRSQGQTSAAARRLGAQAGQDLYAGTLSGKRPPADVAAYVPNTVE